MVNGHEITLVRDGRMDKNAMRHALVSPKDLDEALRQQAGGVPLDEVERAVLERDGKLSIVKRRP
nr:YetF domain-containing protein [Variovorax sp. YR750]